MEPIWLAKNVEQFFKDNVAIPFRKPLLYHPTHAPIPWLNAMFGRGGVEKLKSIEALIAKYEIDSYDIIDVKIGDTVTAMNHIEGAKRVIAAQPNDGDTIGPFHLLVIDHADILCYEPDNEASMIASINLKVLETYNIMTIALFDRLPGASDPSKITQYAKECQSKFFLQFVTMGYMPCPDADFRIEMFKYVVGEFFAHFHSHSAKCKLNNEMTDHEYTMLADCSTFATGENIKAWLRNVFYDIIRTSDTKEVIDINFKFFEDHMRTTNDTPHICMYDARDVENEFSTGCGKGPIAKPRKKIVAQQPDGDLNVTGFTIDAADLTKASKLLEKSSNKKREREIDDEAETKNAIDEAETNNAIDEAKTNNAIDEDTDMFAIPEEKKVKNDFI